MSDAAKPFPEIKPYDQRQLAVGDDHRIYLEQAGNPDGLPVVFLHGGPGAGCNAWQRRLFDPSRFRVVLFDQRGCGRSTPRLGLRANTTQDLIADIEAIRADLGIERWMVVGGSWGALLGIAYAQAHPERVLGLALRALLFGGKEDIHWAFVQGPQQFNPELWSELTALLPAAERTDPIAALGARLTDADPRIHVPAAQVWLAYERNLSQVKGRSMALPKSLAADGSVDPAKAPTTPYLEWHYICNDFFLKSKQLLLDANRLAGIPGILVQGRYDLLCPPRLPHALVNLWPEGELRIVEAAGHDIADPGVGAAVMQAISDVADRV